MMKAVAVRELETHFSDYIRLLQSGERVLVTYQGAVVAELRSPEPARDTFRHPGFLELARRGTARRIVRNDSSAYPRLERALGHTSAQALLDEERGNR